MKRLRRSVDDDGFTFIELLVSISILTIVLAATTTAMIVYFQIGRTTMQRDDHSGGAATTATYLDRDLASADVGSVTLAGTSCSGALNVFSLKWTEWTASVIAPSPVPGPSSYTVAYRISPDVVSSPPGGGVRYQLERWYCPAGGLAARTVLLDNLVTTSALTVSTVAISGCDATPIRVTLARYASGSAANDQDVTSDYTYSGCIGGRRR